MIWDSDAGFESHPPTQDDLAFYRMSPFCIVYHTLTFISLHFPLSFLLVDGDFRSDDISPESPWKTFLSPVLEEISPRPQYISTMEPAQVSSMELVPMIEMHPATTSTEIPMQEPWDPLAASEKILYFDEPAEPPGDTPTLPRLGHLICFVGEWE